MRRFGKEIENPSIMVEGSPREAFAKVIFIQFNPLIRRLCETVQSYHACKDTKPKLPLLASITKLLDLLQDQLNWLVSSGADKDDISHAINLISDFLTLPLRSILCRVSTWDILTSSNGNTGQNVGNSRAALQSSAWKCVERTSRILHQIVELSVEYQRDEAKMTSCLAAFVDALPSHQVAEQTSSACFLLDKGEFCLESIYMAAGTIVRLGNMKTFSGEAIRLLDIAVTLLEPPEGEKSKDKSPKVQLLAITFISKCLDQIQNARDWRKVFPATYAALYRRILRYPLQSKRKHEASSITNIAIQCITKLLRVALSKGSCPTTSIVERLKEMSRSANGQVGESSETPEKFHVESRRLLPPTLIAMSDLVTVNFPSSIKVSFMKLCSVLLGEISDLSESEDYKRKILESVLLHLQDKDENVKRAVESTIQVYTQTNPNALDFIGPRIIELIEHLGAIAQDNQGSKLEDALRLISNHVYVAECDKGLRAATRSLFSSESFLKNLMQNFAILYDQEFNTRPLRGKLILVLDQHKEHGSDTQLRYIQEAQIQVVNDTVGDIGRLLGRKRAVLVMDHCFSEMCRSSLSIHAQSTFRSEQQVEWLHTWIGCFPFLKSIQSGAFPETHHYLGKLASAILPVLVTSSLWSIHTHRPQEGDKYTGCSLHGNTKFTLHMLEFVAGLVGKLDTETLHHLMPSLLPGVLEKLRDCIQENIQAAANLILTEISDSLGFPDPSAMLVENIEAFFLPYARGHLRLARRKIASHDNGIDNGIDNGLKYVIELSCVVFHLGSKYKGRESPSTLLPSIHRFASNLAKRFDELAIPDRDDEKTALLFALFFNETIRFTMHLRNQAHPHVTVQEFKNEEEPWFQLLSRFRVVKDKENEAMKNEPSSYSIDSQERQLITLKDDTVFIDRMTWRLGYLINHSKLSVQTRAYECMGRSFQYLGWISILCSEFEVEEHNGPKTAILRQIHASWSTIEARMKSATNKVLIPFGTSSLLLSQRHTEASSDSSVSEHRHVLSSLFALVATICEVSDDFMASRWRPCVWPYLKQVLEVNLRRFGANRKQESCAALLQQSEVTLLGSALDSIGRVYRHRPTGRTFSGLIPETVSLLLPFVNCGDATISKKAVAAIESLASIDGDALYRPLLKCCGGKATTCKWNQHFNTLLVDETPNQDFRKLFEKIRLQREQEID